MSKEIKKILDSLEEDLSAISLEEEQIVLSVIVEAQKENVVHYGSLKFKLKDILDALRLIDKIITSVRRIRKKLKNG